MEKIILIKKLGKGSNQIEELLSAISRVDKLRIFSFEPFAPFRTDRKTYELKIPLKVFLTYAQDIYHEISSAGYSKLNSRIID